MRRHPRRVRGPRMTCPMRLLFISAFVGLFAAGCWLAGAMLTAAV